MSRRTLRRISLVCGAGLLLCMLVSAMLPVEIANYVILGVPVFLVGFGLVNTFSSRCPCCGKRLRLYKIRECPKCGMEIDVD